MGAGLTDMRRPDELDDGLEEKEGREAVRVAHVVKSLAFKATQRKS